MPPDAASILERLDRLERQNERLHRQNHRLKSGLAVGIVVVAAVGVASCQSKSAAPVGPIGPGTVEVERLVLKDADGRVHGSFAATPEGASLFLFDPAAASKPRAGLVATKDGATLSVYDSPGQERVRVSSNEFGQAVLFLAGSGRPRVGLVATPT